MNASQLIEQLNELIKTHGDLELVYAKDDEGNGYDKVFYAPSAGHYNENEKEFHSHSNKYKKKPNAICIN